MVGSAAADVSVSGAQNFFYGSGSGSTVGTTANEDSVLTTGGSVAWTMSTETANGVTVGGSASISADTDGIGVTDNATAVGGMSQLTFGMDGMTITLGDINNAGSGTGEGGDVTSFASTVAATFVTAAAASADDSAMDGIADGTGINVSTTVGTASVDITYVPTVGSGRNSHMTAATTTGNTGGVAINIGMDVGGASVNLAAGNNSENTAGQRNDEAFALEASYPVSDALTLTVGGSSGTVADADEDNAFIHLSYTVDADTTLTAGYTSGENTTTANVVDKATTTSVNLSRSLGGGVSVFAEYAAVDADNAGTNTDGSAVAVGTTVSF